MFKITYHCMARFNPIIPSVTKRFTNKFSSAPPIAAIKTENENVDATNRNQIIPTKKDKVQNHLVAAAFASLKPEAEKINGKDYTTVTTERIASAKNVEELLSISEGAGISRKSAVKVISVLAEWLTAGKVTSLEFETDARFLRLCKILAKNNVKNSSPSVKSEDLETIVSVTENDKAAELISSLSLSQMVRVMTLLGQQRRRPTPVLRSLAFNIAKNTDKLNIKQCGDLLYSSAILNFNDQNCLEKIISDICVCIQNPLKGSVIIGSILNSFGILRYKNEQILDDLSEWILNNQNICRTQDIVSLFITLAVLNYHPANAKQLYEKLVPQLNMSELSKPSSWLAAVWSLVVLNQVTQQHVDSVLSKEFIEKSSSFTSKLKLLNIDAASKLLLKNYEGANLSENHEFRNLTPTRTKGKELLVNSIQDTLNNMLNAKTQLRTNINTGMGFFIDAEVAINKERKFLPVNQENSSLQAVDTVQKTAILVHDYHDFSQGSNGSLTGLNQLCISLLQAKNYNVVTIPYSEYDINEKLVKRVKYLDSKLKNIQ